MSDAAAVHATHPGGFLLGRLDGEPVGRIFDITTFELG